MTGFAERITNELSGLIADTRAKKRVRQAASDDANGGPSTVSVIQAAKDKFKEYREALAILIQMYKDGVITKDEVKDAITILENNPIWCVTFCNDY